MTDTSQPLDQFAWVDYLPQSDPDAPTVEDLQAQIHALRADYLRMANAVAKQLPDRDKFFADLIPNRS